MKRICLVHGWNVPDGGANTVDQFAPWLEKLGYEVDTDEADYGHLTWEMFSWIARKAIRPWVIRRLRRAFAESDVVVTHSNGANFAHRALNTMDQDRPRLLIHFSPALNRNTPRPKGVKRMHVFFNTTDNATRFARLIPFHIWGSMGTWGAKEVDDSVKNHDGTQYLASVKGHSGWFRPGEHAEFFARCIHRIVEDEL